MRAEHLDKLVVTRAVLEEAMRLYPPAPAMTRQAACTTELGGETIPEGANIVISIFVVHRHRHLWDDPDRFDPERFMPERRDKILRTQFMPFGFGARTCIGASFAMMEGDPGHAGAGRSVRVGRPAPPRALEPRHAASQGRYAAEGLATQPWSGHPGEHAGRQDQ